MHFGTNKWHLWHLPCRGLWLSSESETIRAAINGIVNFNNIILSDLYILSEYFSSSFLNCSFYVIFFSQILLQALLSCLF